MNLLNLMINIKRFRNVPLDKVDTVTDHTVRLMGYCKFSGVNPQLAYLHDLGEVLGELTTYNEDIKGHTTLSTTEKKLYEFTIFKAYYLKYKYNYLQLGQFLSTGRKIPDAKGKYLFALETINDLEKYMTGMDKETISLYVEANDNLYLKMLDRAEGCEFYVNNHPYIALTGSSFITNVVENNIKLIEKSNHNINAANILLQVTRKYYAYATGRVNLLNKMLNADYYIDFNKRTVKFIENWGILLLIGRFLFPHKFKKELVFNDR